MSDEDELFTSLLFGRRKELEDGRSYVVKEKKPEKALALFFNLVEKGYRPLLITRQHPNHVRKAHLGVDIRAIWLSTTLGKDYIDPHNLNALTNEILTHIAGGGKSVVLLDGLEYLMINNDPPRIWKFLEYLNEVVAQTAAILLVSVDDRAFEPRDLALLERNAVVLEWP
ncbi:MAG: DUF835 domain-containing protein [Methanobacteriota archaeon]|nr:MAG: DUF835 domain-containing protein [Euryarchaeota archaeon]